MHRRKQSSSGADAEAEAAESSDIPSPLLGDSPAITTSHHHPPSLNGRSVPNGHSAYGSPKSPRLDATPPPRTRVGSNPGLRVASPLSLSSSAGMFNGSRSPKAINRPLFSQPPPIRQSSYPEPPATASPYRSSFGFNAIPESSEATMNKDYHPSRHLRHSRSQSGAAYLGQYASIYGSSTSSSSSPTSPPPKSPRLSAPPPPLVPFEDANGSTSSARQHAHHHSRIHSRNLSIFFPRPGALPPQHAAIVEGGAQEIEFDDPSQSMPGHTLIEDPATRSTLGVDFKFGAPNPDPMTPLSPRMNSGGPKRRGHHHKHSVSHNFFSFMEPTSLQMPQQANGGFSSSQPGSSLTSASLGAHTLPTPSTTHFPSSSMQHHFVTPTPGSTSAAIASARSTGVISASLSTRARVFSVLQFVLGAWMWVEGQRQGSLACTGLGYWVVFDSVGVYMGYMGARLRREERSDRRSYGSRRVETVALFAQAIYLIFASVYVCKEAFEHVLLASESGAPDPGDAHHHHPSMESFPEFHGLQYPTTILCFSLSSLLVSGFSFCNHDRLVEATGNHLPTPLSLIKTLMAITSSPRREKSSSAILCLLSNPFTILPSFFAASILSVSLFLPSSQHHSADIALACVETVLTFMVAYPAAVALGKVLLQTAPDRGLPGGQMESFLRVMKDLEQHHQIIHLPAPHLWQLTPVPPNAKSHHSSDHEQLAYSEEGSLVATVQLHVRKDLDDSDLLKLTSEVWERCTRALGISGVVVTVSVVRG